MSDGMNDGMSNEIGNLIHLKLSDVWQSESPQFNTYIANNLDRISELINEELILVEQEYKPLEDSRRSLDILAKTGRGELVAIELQFGGADGSHSWRLLSYAKAINAAIGILVCEEIDEFYRQAWQSLNEDSRSVQYYVLLAHTFKIDESLPALTLEIAVEPSDKEKIVKGLLSLQNSKNGKKS